MFVGGVVAATVELISLDPAISAPVHSYGTVSRWIVMYPWILLTKHSWWSELQAP